MTTPAKLRPLDRGPQTGAPPSLEQVAVDRLLVDPAYQRATDGARSRAIVRGMIREWDWRRCQPLDVARRADGSLYVVDGQHRLDGAKSRGDILFLPCVIAPSPGPADEARAFVALNTERQALSQYDKFVAMLAAGDEAAIATAALVEAAGWRIVRGKFNGAGEAGKLNCAPLLVGLRKRFGDDILRLALGVLREAWPRTVVGPVARLTEALCVLLRDRVAPLGVLVRTLSDARQPGHWTARAERLRAADSAMSVVQAYAAAIREALPRGASSPPLAPPAPRPATPPPAQRPIAPPRPKTPAPAPAFGVSGKGFCDQCDRLVTSGEAANCRDAHCSMKHVAAVARGTKAYA